MNSVVQNIKVAIVASSYPRFAGDSSAVFLRQLAENLYKRKIEVHVIAPADQEPGVSVEDGIIVHRFQYFFRRWQKLAYGSGITANLQRSPWLWIQVLPFIFGLMWALIKIAKKERPDIIHAHWVIPQGLVASLLRPFHRMPLITTIHGGDAFTFTGSLINRLKLFVLWSSHAWTSNTIASSAAIRGSQTYDYKRHIIPMGVDVDFFRSGRREALRRSENIRYVILFVGRLVEKKGGHDLIKAFTLLSPDLLSNTELWIVGSGDQRASLETQAAHLEEKIKFLGEIPNDKLPDYYAAADLFVGPSLAEGQGIVFLEAFSSGVCVIATDVGGVSEVVDHGITGLLVPPGDPKRLAEAIERSLNDSKLRKALSINGLAKAKKNYSWGEIAHDFELLYLSVFTSNRS